MTVAVTVIGPNVVMDYGTHEAAVAAMESMQANRASSYLPIMEIERLRRIEQLAVNVVAATQPGDLDDALAALDEAIGGLDG